MITIGREGAPEAAGERTPDWRGGVRLVPGRKLPATVADFSCEQLPRPTAELILALVRLVEANVGSFPELARKAHRSTADLPRPRWAVGDPGDDARVRTCAQQLSKKLGKGARKTPDWPTVAWVLRLCITDEHERATATREIAALWQEAVGGTAPSAGDNEKTPRDNDNPAAGDNPDLPGDNARPSSDNDNPGDVDNAMASRLAERERQLQALMEQVRAMGQANAEQRARLLRTELDLQQERDNNHRTQQALRAALDRLKADHAAAVETHGRQLRHAVDNGDRRVRALKNQLETTRHHTAVLAAHIYVNHNHAQREEIGLETLLPIPRVAGPELGLHHELRTMLNPDPKLKTTSDSIATSYLPGAALPDRTITTWLRVYVRALLGQAHPEGLFTVFDAEQAGQLDAFTSGGPLPSGETLRALIKAHPALSAYLPSLVNAATNPDKPDRAVLVPIPDDLLATTTPPSRRTRHTPTVDARVTVAELYARGDVHKALPRRDKPGDKAGDKPGDNTGDKPGDNARTV